MPYASEQYNPADQVQEIRAASRDADTRAATLTKLKGEWEAATKEMQAKEAVWNKAKKEVKIKLEALVEARKVVEAKKGNLANTKATANKKKVAKLFNEKLAELLKGELTTRDGLELPSEFRSGFQDELEKMINNTTSKLGGWADFSAVALSIETNITDELFSKEKQRAKANRGATLNAAHWLAVGPTDSRKLARKQQDELKQLNEIEEALGNPHVSTHESSLANDNGVDFKNFITWCDFYPGMLMLKIAKGRMQI